MLKLLKPLTPQKLLLFILVFCFHSLNVQADGFINIDGEDVIEPEVSPSPTCDFPSSKYRKKITASFFPKQNTTDVGIIDYYGFEKGIGTEILQRLSDTGNFLVKHGEHINLYPDTGTAPYIHTTDTADGTSLLATIEKKLDVQYVISGVIRDISYSDFSNSIALPFGLSINKDLFVSPINQPNTANKRNLVIDFYLHDTQTEELISSRHYSHYIDADMVKPERAIAFSSQEFFTTAYGKLFNEILIDETTAIIKTLACRPYTVKIIDKDKKNIYLNAGSQNRVKTGDILNLYHADIEGHSFDTNSYRKQFGWPKSKLRIIKVFPAYSIAVSDSKEVLHLEKNRDYLLAW